MPWARLAGLSGVIVAGWCLHWLTTDPAFAVNAAAVPIEGARYTSATVLRSRAGLALDGPTNLFQIATRDLERALAALPALRGAVVTASLPDQLTVQVVERQPILVLRTAVARWLVDVEGVLFAPDTAASTDEPGSGADGSGLPAVDDMRAEAAGMRLGDRLDPLDLEVARLLGSLAPADVGSTADALALRIEEPGGWVLESVGSWQARFGLYTPALRPPGQIPLQVQCLRALLANRERDVGVVTLSVSGDRCGTFREAGPRRPGARSTPAADDAGPPARERERRATPRPRRQGR
jgi:hypothetical protein